MSKERYNQIIDEAYKSYCNNRPSQYHGPYYTKEEFINKCKADLEFSERWGLKIEERELDDDAINVFLMFKMKPTKLITLTYNNETIEVYE